jgi:PilZ domain
MTSAVAERRRARRFPLAVSAGARIWKSALPEQNVELINISAQGLYFASAYRYREGDMLEMSLKLPLVTEGPLPEWRCIGKVVRVQALDSGSRVVGVALRLGENRIGGKAAEAPFNGS